MPCQGGTPMVVGDLDSIADFDTMATLPARSMYVVNDPGNRPRQPANSRSIIQTSPPLVDETPAVDHHDVVRDLHRRRPRCQGSPAPP